MNLNEFKKMRKHLSAWVNRNEDNSVGKAKGMCAVHLCARTFNNDPIK